MPDEGRYIVKGDSFGSTPEAEPLFLRCRVPSRIEGLCRAVKGEAPCQGGDG